MDGPDTNEGSARNSAASGNTPAAASSQATLRGGGRSTTGSQRARGPRQGEGWSSVTADGPISQDMHLGIGILGAAAIARKNVRAIGRTKNGVEVMAVGSRSLAKAQKFLEETGLAGQAQAYGSYEEVLEDPAVDAVYIPLPTAIHLEWVRKAAAAKKHILLEKPIALTAEATDQILSACEEAGVQLMDGTMWEHNPRAEAMCEVISDAKRVGKTVSVTSTFTWKASEDFMRNDVRTRKDGDALGCYGDIGWYCIRAGLWAFAYDKPSQVQAHPGVVFNENGVVMHGGATVLWADGKRLTFDCGFDCNHSMYLQVNCVAGSVELNDFCIPYREDKCEFLIKGPGVWKNDDTAIDQDISKRQVLLDRPQETFMWEHFAEYVYRIRNGAAPSKHWPAKAALTNKVVVAVEQSAQRGGVLIDLEL